MFEFDKCDMHGEFGGCKLQEMTPLTKTNTCTLCGKKIPEDCDILNTRRPAGTTSVPTAKGLEYKLCDQS